MLPDGFWLCNCDYLHQTDFLKCLFFRVMNRGTDGQVKQPKCERE